MPRYYYTGNVRYAREGNSTIAEILRCLRVLTWDAKKHKHNFVCHDYEAENNKWGWNWACGVPFTFATTEHEREFLDFHPDAKDLRVVYSRYHGYCVATTIEVIDYEELPIFKKGNRWFWKK
jgi:hypothetical protein